MRHEGRDFALGVLVICLLVFALSYPLLDRLLD